MHKIMFQYGSLVLPSYTLMAIVAMFGAMVPVLLEANRLGWNMRRAFWLAPTCTAVGFLGSHFLYALTRLGLEWNAWVTMFFRVGYGHVWFGGFLASWAYCYFYAKKNGIRPLRMYDVGSFAVLIAQPLGRVGCLMNGCCYGSPTTLPWGVVLPTVEFGVTSVHPVQLYEAFFQLAVFTYLWTRRTHQDGYVFFRYLLLIPAGRFLFEFLRGDSIRGTVFGFLTTSQSISVVLMAAAIYFMRRLKLADSR